MHRVIEIQNLEVAYGAQIVLGPLSLSIVSGEFLCILGESGCGKSTLLRILAGLRKPTAGRVEVDDKPITGPDYRRGVVFQAPALLPWLSVEKNVSLGFQIRGQKVPKQRIHDVLASVGLKGFERAKPQNLSGGMAQRVALARAMINNPNVLLMDEPFGALDALTRLRMQQEVQRIWKLHNLTVVFVTHDIEEAIFLGSRIAVMTPRPGRISRVLQVNMEYPRSIRSSDFQRLKGVITEELSDMEPQIDVAAPVEA